MHQEFVGELSMLDVLVDRAEHESISECSFFDLAWFFELLKVLEIAQVVYFFVFLTLFRRFLSLEHIRCCDVLKIFRLFGLVLRLVLLQGMRPERGSIFGPRAHCHHHVPVLKAGRANVGRALLSHAHLQAVAPVLVKAARRQPLCIGLVEV